MQLQISCVMITSNLTLHIKISSGFENLNTNCKYLNEFQGLNTNTQEKKILEKTLNFCTQIGFSAMTIIY